MDLDKVIKALKAAEEGFEVIAAHLEALEPRIQVVENVLDSFMSEAAADS